MGETIYNLINNTSKVTVNLGPGTYSGGIYYSGLLLVNHTGLKKDDIYWVSARFSVHNVKNVARYGFEPSFDWYSGCWNYGDDDFNGIIACKYKASKDIDDGTTIGQDGVYVQGTLSDSGFVIEDGGWIKIDHVMMNKGPEPAAWAPSSEEVFSIGGGGNMIEVKNWISKQPGDELVVNNDSLTTDHRDYLFIDADPAFKSITTEENTKFHVSISLKTTDDCTIQTNKLWCWICYKDSSGNKNFASYPFVSSAQTVGNKWVRLETTITVPSGMNLLMFCPLAILAPYENLSLYAHNVVLYPVYNEKKMVDARDSKSFSSVKDGATGPQGENGVDLSNGKMLFTDPYFAYSNNSCYAYNNAGNGTVNIERVGISSDNPFSATAVTSYELKIINTGAADPGCGGFFWNNQSRVNAIFIYRIIAKIPTGRHLIFASNPIGNDASIRWLTSNDGTGKFTEYIFKIICGTTGTFEGTGFFYIDGSVGTAGNPIEWRVAYATCFDMTSGSDVATALSTANGKNKVIYSTSDPSSTSGYKAGDVWFNQSTGGIWQFNGSVWVVHQVGTVSIKDGAITADKIVAHAVTSEQIGVGNLAAISADLGKVTAGSIRTPDDGKTFTLDATNKKFTWNLPQTSMAEDGTITSTAMTAKGIEYFSQFGAGKLHNYSSYDGYEETVNVNSEYVAVVRHTTANGANTYNTNMIDSAGFFASRTEGGIEKSIFAARDPRFGALTYNGCRVPVVVDGTATASVGRTSCYLTSLSSLQTAGLDGNHIIVVAMLITAGNVTHIEGVQYLSSNSSYYALFSGGITSGTSVRWMAISYF